MHSVYRADERSRHWKPARQSEMGTRAWWEERRRHDAKPAMETHKTKSKWSRVHDETRDKKIKNKINWIVAR